MCEKLTLIIPSFVLSFLILCFTGFNPTSGQTGICPSGRFGPPTCLGECHCLSGPTVCDNEDGACSDSLCSWGWSQAPQCQTPCNNTFGLQCRNLCHCPLGDSCNRVNGICSLGRCHLEWFGAGCQIRLPKLIAPPLLENVTCGQVDIQWDAWTADFDSGEGPIHSYSLWHRNRPVGPWQNIENIPVTTSLQRQYNRQISVTDPESEVQFRVDCNMLDDGKKVVGPPGVPSETVLPTCITTTSAVTPPSTKPTTTTRRPPGGRLFNTVAIDEVGSNFLVLNWTLMSNISKDSLDISVRYQQTGIGDCNDTKGLPVTVNVNQSAGFFTLDNLLPWRKYDVTVTAVDFFNTTDEVSFSASTGETAPIGVIIPSDVQLISRTSGSLTVSWQPILCEQRGGKLVYYEIRVRRSANDSSMRLERTTAEFVTLDELSPFTRYQIAVRYVNSVQNGTFGEDKTLQTAEDVPSPPFINSTTVSSNSIVLNWLKPDRPNGVITKYGISYQDEGGLESIASLPDLTPQVTLLQLRSYTTYTIKVRAETNAGWGNFSEAVSVRTLQAVPGPPAQVQHTASNESCIQLTWLSPVQSNGIIESYEVSYKQIMTYSAKGLNATLKTSSIPAPTTSASICELQAATYYRFQVTAKTGAGEGSATEALHVWTLQGFPEAPPSPNVLDVNQTTATLELSSTQVTTGPLTAYRLVVEKIETEKRKRDIGLNLPGYVTAEFRPQDVARSTVFVVGDGKSYGGFENKVLEKNSVYDVAFVVISELQGLNRSSYSNILRPLETLDSGNPVPVARGDVLQTVFIIIGVLLFIFLILLIIFLIWYCRTRNTKYHVFSTYSKDNEKVKLSVYDPDEDLLKNWSKTKNFTQKRHVVSGLLYLQTRRGMYPQDVPTKKSASIKPNPRSFISLHKEFYSLPHKKRACIAAQKRANEKLNRFDHLLPYDITRVVLRPDENASNDYVNASYIDGYKRNNAYIAAMSPFNEETVLEFWRMIYQLRLPVVVMITKVEEQQFIKCTQYWPDVQGVVTFANFILQLESVEEFADYVVRVIMLKGREEKDIHIVRVFDYISWPEHGVPNDSIPLLEMRNKVRMWTPDDSPVLVHCGTGVGRTGAYIAIDGLLEQYHQEHEVNVYQFVKKMRENRTCMVRTIRQYAFIYDSLFEAVVAGDLYVGEDLKERYRDMISKNHKTGHTYLKDQFLSLQEFTPKLKRPECTSGLLPANVSKNRYPDLLPPDSCRPLINTLGGPGRTDYINAVFLNGHTRVNKYILTQTPLPSTVLDFWKLVYDYKVTTIVMMEETKTKTDHAHYWPDDNNMGYDASPYVVEATESTVEGENEEILISSFRLHNLQQPRAQPREVRIFQLQSWTGPSFVPSSKTVLLDLVDLVDDWQKLSSGDTTPIVAHCSDGATQSGLFCAVSIICNKMLLEGNVDIYHTVKHLKRRRPQIVDQLEQYRFCYKTLWDFISLRLTEKSSISQGSYSQEEKLFDPSPDLSLFSSIYDVNVDEVVFKSAKSQSQHNLLNPNDIYQEVHI